MGPPEGLIRHWSELTCSPRPQLFREWEGRGRERKGLGTGRGKGGVRGGRKGGEVEREGISHRD